MQMKKVATADAATPQWVWFRRIDDPESQKTKGLTDSISANPTTK
jgi:hypothetical protein